MKLFIKSICVAFVLTVIFSILPFEAECSEISKETFRLHILANSDTENDQALKIKVRDKVLEYTEELFNNAKSKNEAEKVIAENIQAVNDVAYNEILNNGFTYPVKTEITNMYFTTRYYDNYTLPSGMYDALRVTIGEGKGRNWWCVMYPTICVSPVEEQEEKAKEVFDDKQYDIVTNTKFQYKFKIVEIFEKICSCFG